MNKKKKKWGWDGGGEENDDKGNGVGEICDFVNLSYYL